jgi:hypothetical protein
MRIPVVSDLAQVVNTGVSNPATASVASSATILAMTAPGRGECAPTVVLPIPLNRRIVKSTTLSP